MQGNDNMIALDEAKHHGRTGFLSRYGRLALSCCGLLLLLLLDTAASATAADGAPPRQYLPLINRDFDAAWQWLAPITPTLTPAPDHIVLALDNAGQIHLLWDVSPFSQPRFVYHSFAGINTGGAWSQPAPVAASLGESSLLYTPVPGPDGALHLLWHNLVEPNHQQQLLCAAFRSGAWSMPEVAYQAGGSVTGMVRADNAGRLAATVVDSGSGLSSNIFQVARLDDGTWATPLPITRSHWFPTVVWPDSAGGVHLYEDAASTPPQLYYSHWRNGAFAVHDQPVAARVFGRDTTLDALGNLHISWSDLTAIPGRNIQAIYHQCLANGDQPLTAEIPSGEQAVNDYVSASDTAGRFALAWREESGVLRLGVWRGCVRQAARTVPLPAGSAWGLRALALSATPDAACLLLAQTSYPPKYALVCGSAQDAP